MTPAPAPPRTKRAIPWYMNLAFGGVGAVTATVCVQPLDTARIRVQVDARGRSSWLAAAHQALRAEGVPGLYAGLSAGVLRQLFYGTTRFGAFQVFGDAAKRALGADRLSTGQSAACALAAGALAGVVGNPADVALTRMAADARAPPELRRGYRNGAHAVVRIAREEGVARGLMSGVAPNVARAVAVNVVMLTTYTATKDAVCRASGLDADGVLAQFLAGVVAGVNTAAAAGPVDNVKTRLQNARPGELDGAASAARAVWRERGLVGFWRGFWPFALKLAPHTTITMVCVEQCRAAYAA